MDKRDGTSEKGEGPIGDSKHGKEKKEKDK